MNIIEAAQICVSHLRAQGKSRTITGLNIAGKDYQISIEESDRRQPRRFRWPVERHPNGSDSKWGYGVYFPGTDLSVTDMGMRYTGEPCHKQIEWLD